MKKPRFPLFFIDKVVDGKAVISDKEQLHHLRDVLRLQVNDFVDLSDIMDNFYTGEISTIDKKHVEVKITMQWETPKSPVKLAVACAIPKGGRFDDVVDYLTQLGVERIIPMQTERAVVRLDRARAEEKHKRWVKIARNAAQQSHRIKIPVIEPVTGFDDAVLRSGDYDLKLIPTVSDEIRSKVFVKEDALSDRGMIEYDLSEKRLIKDVLAKSRPKNIIVLIGPEGDFTPEEVALALHNGFTPLSLGETVLRVATAAIAVAGYIKFALDE
ncbi:MAG: hypothetical protein A2Z15_03360 [Chloroflexi bacterium RBG_16_50_11]|nr:MAG: hypothetical protein A2Z15_03360 [Chloroflexi bacterium RBG_16_50_11]